MFLSTHNGRGRLTFQGPRDKPVAVWYHRPTTYSLEGPILFILHGAKRNGRECLEHWVRESEKRGALAVAPEFRSRHYPGVYGYNLGGVLSENGDIRSRSDWSYWTLERLFDAILIATGSRASYYLAYGHSAGAQFLCRALLLGCLCRVERVVAANAGWYTLPSFSSDFPYGLRGLEERDYRRQAFRKHLLILLGEEDNVPDKNFRQMPQAMEQGRNRLERGKYAYSVGAETAGIMGESFNWSLRSLPNIGHHSPSMVPTAADWLFASGTEGDS
ncbi:MAG: hypothetical protein KJ749_04220 [Planctomycetes bacterium]|nr:hypothetical protein [Planctomycetota bacterium]